jgi:hypothetical protein
MSTESIIQGVLSPKVVSDGNGGYTAKTDIVNVDNITATGTLSVPAINSAGGTLGLHSINATGDITATGNITASGNITSSSNITASDSINIGNASMTTNGSGEVFFGSSISIGTNGAIYCGASNTEPVVIATPLQTNGTITTSSNRPMNLNAQGINLNTSGGLPILLNGQVLVSGPLSANFYSTQAGIASISSGTATIYIPLLTASSIILVTPVSPNPGTYYVTPATGSFTITTTNTTDTIKFNYFIPTF